MMETVKKFCSDHFKGLVIGGLLTVATLGLWAIVKVFKN